MTGAAQRSRSGSLCTLILYPRIVARPTFLTRNTCKQIVLAFLQPCVPLNGRLGADRHPGGGEVRSIAAPRTRLGVSGIPGSFGSSGAVELAGRTRRAEHLDMVLPRRELVVGDR